MADETSTSSTIRSELVDVATEFLQNPRIIGEKMERKREFLQKKGLTDTEINYAFKLIPQEETPKPVISNHRSSFLRRLFNNLAFASVLALAIKTIKHSFHSQSESDQKNELNETIKNLQKTVLNMQTSIRKLEQTADQLNTTVKTPNPNRSLFEELKQEIQGLKELFSGRSQVPSNTANNDGIIFISKENKNN